MQKEQVEDREGSSGKAPIPLSLLLSNKDEVFVSVGMAEKIYKLCIAPWHKGFFK